MHFKKTLCSALLAFALLLTACGGSQADTTPTLEPQAVLTAAAQTAQAKMTELAAQNPSPLPPTHTSTPTTPTVTPTQGAAAATTAAPPAAAGGSDRVEYVADLTVPDGTVFRPGEKFTKSWRLMNAGTSTWTTAYSLVFFSGEQMGGPASTALSVQVPPGQTLDVSVTLTAPSNEGKHTGYWLLRNAAGTNFGMGANSDGAFYVQINVSGTAAGTPGTATATSSGEDSTEATISVDASDVVGPCPHSFNFTGTITIGEAATVTYVLEVEADIPLNLPGPTTTSLGAGTSQVTYTLELSDSANGSVTLHVTSPEDVRSDPIGFSLTCQ